MTEQAKHTLGRLEVSGLGMVTKGLLTHHERIASVGDGWAPDQSKESDANALHLAACWNACEGINPQAVPELLEAAKTAEAVLSDYQIWHDDGTRCKGLETATQNTLRAVIAKAEKGE